MSNQIERILADLEKRSQLEKSRKVDVAPEDRMLAITKDTGIFFHALLLSIGARNALELGTSTGYSTLYIARALLENNKKPKITTIEKNPSKVMRARKNFEWAGTAKFTKILQGQVVDMLKKIPKRPQFDFVLIDADKENVKQYFDLALPRLRVGGIIATDNMHYPEKYRGIMANYSRYVSKKPNVWTRTIPVGNGEEISVKIR